MLRMQQTNENTRPFSWGQGEDDIYDPFWDAWQRSAVLEPGVSSDSGLVYALQSCAMALNAVCWIVMMGIYKPFARLGAVLSHLFQIPLAVAQKQRPIVGIRQKKPARFWRAVRENAPVIKDRLRVQLTSPEFWLGVMFGAATRITTRLAIATAFESRPGLATAAGFITCAGAGLAAGIVAHLVRAWYRNLKRAEGQAKENYWSRALLESAIIGLFGGTLGGYATNAGAVIARAGGFALGASAGVAAAVVHVGMKSFRSSTDQRNKIGWGKMAFQGAAFGALGGVLGIVFADLIGAHDSIAAPIGTAARSVVPLSPHAAFVHTQDAAASPPLLPPAVAPIEPVHSVTVSAQELGHTAAAAPPPPPVQHVVEGQTQPRVALDDKCRPVVKHVRHHVKHIKHIRHIKPKPPVVLEKPVMLEQTLPPPPPPLPPLEVIQPPPAPLDPCQTGPCATPPCNTNSLLDIQGPCADPRTPCVEKISFNEHGEATKVVLEPRAARVSAPYFEAEVPKKITTWSSSRHGMVHPSSTNEPVTKEFALVMPLVNGPPGMQPTPV